MQQIARDIVALAAAGSFVFVASALAVLVG